MPCRILSSPTWPQYPFTAYPRTPTRRDYENCAEMKTEKRKNSIRIRSIPLDVFPHSHSAFFLANVVSNEHVHSGGVQTVSCNFYKILNKLTNNTAFVDGYDSSKIASSLAFDANGDFGSFVIGKLAHTIMNWKHEALMVCW